MDDSMEDERDLSQIMADKRAAEAELDVRDVRTGGDTDDESTYRQPKKFRAGQRPSHGASSDDGDEPTQSSPGRSQRSVDDITMTDQTDDDPYEDEYDDDDEHNMYRVQGTLREWVTRDEVKRFISKKFKDFLLTCKKKQGDLKYIRLINEMVLANKCSLEIDYKQFIFVLPNIAIWLVDAPQSVLEVFEEVAKQVVFKLHENYKNIQQKIYVRISNLPVYDQIRNI